MTKELRSIFSINIERSDKLKYKYENIIGEKYNMLTIIDDLGTKKVNGKYNRLVRCKCDCGNEKILNYYQIKEGKIKSCGCLKHKAHRQSYKNPRLYNIYRAMISRCYNKNHEAYENYGGRGIMVCDEWLNNIDSFIKWAKENGYGSKLSIDRIDNNKGYSPNNCRWVTMKEQASNRRKRKENKTSKNTLNVSIGGIDRTFASFCRIFDLDYEKAYFKYTHKWGI